MSPPGVGPDRDPPGRSPGDRWVRLLLRLHPAAFREARGDEVRAAVAEDRERAAAGARRAPWTFWARTTADLLVSALRLWVRPARRGGRDGAAVWAAGPGLGHDLVHALRSLRATPVLSAVVVVTLAVGIGLDTALYSVVDAVLIRPLEYRDAERLYQVRSRVLASGELTPVGQAGGDLAALRAGVAAFEEVAAVTTIRQNLTGAGLPRQVLVGWASPNLFAFLGVEPVLGRGFAPDDPPGTVVLDHAFWTGELGGDPGVLGRSVQLDGHVHTIVGVLPAGFRLHLGSLGSAPPALWKNPDRFWQNGDMWGETSFVGGGTLKVVARLRPGVTVERATAELQGVATAVREEVPERAAGDYRLDLVPLHEQVVAGVRATLLLLAGAATAVLLVACANVMGLLLVRARERARDMAVRRALGATRRRLLRLVLLEGLVLALLGGSGGVALAVLGTGVLGRAAPGLPRAEAVAVDGTVLLFALAASLTCTLLVGLVPAVGASRADPRAELAGGRTVAGGGSRLRDGLVVGQLAVSLVLLVAAGLLTSSLARLRSVETGFDPAGVLTFSVSLPGAKYDWPDGSGRFLVELERRIEELPGVRSAGIMWPIPLSGSRWQSPFAAGETAGGGGDALTLVDYRVGSPGFFETLDVRLLEGRLHEPSDPRETVVVSRAVAERAWPGASALGRTLEANPWGGGDLTFEVIGVVDDVRYMALETEPAGALYFDVRGWSWTDWEFDVVVRAEGAPGALLPALRQLVAELDPDLPLAEAAPMTELVARQTADERFAVSLVGLFGTVAGLLALLGLYGVVSHAVGRRTREIGVRMALGSAASDVAALILGRSARLVAAGLGLGILGALAGSRLLESRLFEVAPTDPATWAATVAGLAALALVASWIPARRAIRVDPAAVLRSE